MPIKKQLRPAKGIEDLLRGREDLLESLLQQATATSSRSGARGHGVGGGGGGGGGGGAGGSGPSLDAATARLLSSHRGELSQLIQHQHLSNADRATVDAILRSPATKSYYLSFLSRSQSLLVACGVVHSGMVEGTAWSLNDEAMGFVQEATKPGGSFTKAAKAVKWGRTLAAGVSAAKEQLSGVPFANLAGSILEYLLSSRDEQEQKTQLLRAATFTALATVMEVRSGSGGGGGGGCDAVLERAARALTLHRWKQLEEDHEDFQRRASANGGGGGGIKVGLSARLKGFLTKQVFGQTATAGRGSKDALFQALVGSSVQLPAELRAYLDMTDACGAIMEGRVGSAFFSGQQLRRQGGSGG